jgi:hypothetical protein
MGRKHSISSYTIIQFIHVFPTEYKAKKYAQFRYEQKNIGEEQSLNAKDNPTSENCIKEKLTDTGVVDYKNLRVIRGSMTTNSIEKVMTDFATMITLTPKP